jgi:hypothetical protein
MRLGPSGWSRPCGRRVSVHSPRGSAAPSVARTRGESSVICPGPTPRGAGMPNFLHVSRRHVEEHLEVLTELLFLLGCRLGASLEEYGRCGEFMGGLFSDGVP